MFNVGVLSAKVGRKGEAKAALTEFTKRVCRGAAYPRFMDECARAQELLAAP